MAKKIITLSIDEDLNDRWTKVSKKHMITKTGMVEEYLFQIVPILEAETSNRMMAKAMKQMSKGIDLTASLFDSEDKK